MDTRRKHIKRLQASLTPDSRCWICGTPFTEEWPATADHLVPESLGGTYNVTNLAPAHAVCNTLRANRPVNALGGVLIDLALWCEKILRGSGKRSRRWRPFVMQLDRALAAGNQAVGEVGDPAHRECLLTADRVDLPGLGMPKGPVGVSEVIADPDAGSETVLAGDRRD